MEMGTSLSRYLLWSAVNTHTSSIAGVEVGNSLSRVFLWGVVNTHVKRSYHGRGYLFVTLLAMGRCQ